MSELARVPASLTTIPTDMLDRIFGSLDSRTLFSLAKTCTHFHDYVFERRGKCSHIDIKIHEDKRIEIMVESNNEHLNFQYEETKSKGVLVTIGDVTMAQFYKRGTRVRINNKMQKTVYGESVVTRAVKDLVLNFCGPRMKIKGITFKSFANFSVDEEFFATFSETALRELKGPMNVESLFLESGVGEVQVMGVLPFLKPGFLKKLIIKGPKSNRDWTVVTDTAQWKQLKNFTFFDTGIPFKKYSVSEGYFECKTMKLENLKHLIQIGKNACNRDVPAEILVICKTSITKQARNYHKNLPKIREHPHKTRRYIKVNGQYLIVSMFSKGVHMFREQEEEKVERNEDEEDEEDEEVMEIEEVGEQSEDEDEENMEEED